MDSNTTRTTSRVAAWKKSYSRRKSSQRSIRRKFLASVVLATNVKGTSQQRQPSKVMKGQGTEKAVIIRRKKEMVVMMMIVESTVK